MNTVLRELEAIGQEKVLLRLVCILRDIDSRGCWNTSGKYATFRAGTTYTKAHRASLWAATGAFPEEVLHTCDNPKCINPGHLRSGTHTENMRDCKAKGRTPRGLAKPNAQFIPRHVVISMIADNRSGMTYANMSEKYAVSMITCKRVVGGKHWCSL